MPERRFRADAGLSLADLVVGPARPATVLAAFRSAIYLASAGGRVVAIEASDGVGLPNALSLHSPAVGLALAAVPGEAPAAIGGGVVRAGDLTVTVDRWVDRRVVMDGCDVEVLQRRLAGLDELLAQLGPELPPSLAARVSALTAALGSGRDDVAAATRLLGLGEGLTPSGDDICCGVLAGGRTIARALGRLELDRRLHDLGGAVAAAGRKSTTALSATLLWHAARAEVAQPARHVLRALAGATPLEPAVRALLRVGHTSGRDMGVGLAIGARLALAALDATAIVETTQATVEGASA